MDEGNASFRSVDGVLFSKDGKTILAFPAGREETEYTTPDSVTGIGATAFAGRNNLAEVTIGDSVTRIGAGAFHCCQNLTTVSIGDSVTEIGGENVLRLY